MTSRADIEDRTLVYTCNCGWVDRGHANPKGARELLEQIEAGKDFPRGGVGYPVDYYQSMGWRGFESGAGGSYIVREGLNDEERLSVALAIFQEVTLRFETMQGTAWPERIRTARSSFSQEDLVSNLIGFYAAAKNKKADDLIDGLCKPVPKEVAYEVWDGHDGLSEKVKEWKPTIYACKTCVKGCENEPRTFPAFFGSITPARKASTLDELLSGKGTFLERRGILDEDP